MPFLSFTIIQIAGIHLSSPIGESSITVPALIENCFLQPLHFQMRRVLTKQFSWEPHHGQVGFPSGQRNATRNSSARSMSLKYRIACCNVAGSSLPCCILKLYKNFVGVSSQFLAFKLT